MTRARFPVPRWQTPLPAGVVGSWGPDVELYAARELGLRLDLAQRRILNRALATDADDRLVHRIYLASTGRQSGKTVTVRSLIGWALTAAALPESWREILGLAYDRKQARIPYGAVLEDLRPLARRLGPAPRGGLSLTRYLGLRSGMHGRPTRTYDVASKEAASAIRGMSIDLGLFDELRVHRTPDTWAALLPTMAARPEPIAVVTSTAGDARSVVLRDLFDRGLRIIDGLEPAAGFGMTWYGAREGERPLLELVEAARGGDPAALVDVLAAARDATPAIAGGRITRATVLSELYSLTPAGFTSERLNLWVDELGDEWLPAGVWRRQATPRPDAPEWSGARIILGVEAVPTWRRASIVVAAALADGRAWAGIVGDLDASSRSSSTIAPADLVAELERLRGAWHPAGVAYSASAAAAPHVAAWAEANDVTAWALTAGQLRSACELLRSELVGGRLEHADDPLLVAQHRASRPSSAIEAGSWYLSIRASLGEIDALRSIAWAAWAAISPEALELAPQIF